MASSSGGGEPVLADMHLSPMSVEQLVTKLIQVGFEDHGMGNYGDSVVQVTLDGESFYSLVGPIDYSDGGVVFELVPFPQGCRKHDRVRCQECFDELLAAARAKVNGPFDCPHCERGDFGPTTLVLHITEAHPEHCETVPDDARGDR